MSPLSGLRQSGGLLKAVTKAGQTNKAVKGLPSLLFATNPTSRNISGKVNRDRSNPLPAPFPYWEKEFNIFRSFWDKTSHRLDENSKLIVVEGAHGIGKSQMAKELADELEMLYIPDVTMDDWYTNAYGLDLRDYKEYFIPKNMPFDDKDFVRDPTGGPAGSVDRYHHFRYMLKFFNHMKALRHILNTGQGVVMEKSPFSDFVYWDAAFKKGWIAPASMKFHSRSLDYSLHELLRPNLIIYLDAPTDVVQKKIAAAGNEWDKNSPIWKDKAYLDGIYNDLKRKYLRESQDHSEVLVYDWSEPGDLDVVVEDIEKLNFDHLSLYDSAQADWRFRNEIQATEYRIQFTKATWFMYKMSAITKPAIFDADAFFFDKDEIANQENVAYFLKGNRYNAGFNTEMGDKLELFRTNRWKEMQAHADHHLMLLLPGRPEWHRTDYINE